MTGVEKSIQFHRRNFKFLSLFIVALVFTAVILVLNENNKWIIYSLLAFAVWSAIPAFLSYINIRFLEKNKDWLNVDVPEGYVISKRS